MNVVLEIQAHAATQAMRMLNFFALISGSPCWTHSGIIFSELNVQQ